MTTTIITGPLLKRVTVSGFGPGPYYPKILSAPVAVDGYPSYEEIRNRYSARRVKPIGFELLRNPTSLYVEKRQRQLGTSYASDGTYGPSQAQPGGWSIPYSEELASRWEATLAVRSKIKDQDWNVSTFLGELPETIQYFGKTLSTLVRTYRSVKKGDMREIRKMSKNIKTFFGSQKSATGSVSSKWLEWRYAISPLVYDLDDALKALSNRALARPIVRRSVGGSNKNIRVPDYDPRRVQTAAWTTRMGCYYSVNPTVASWKRLGLINLGATIWELTPLSFVVDWLIPIGSYVGSLDAMAGVSVLSTWESVKMDKHQNFLPLKDGFGTMHTGGYYRERSYSRTPNVSLDLAFPSFGLSLNSSRFLDSLALTRSILLK